MTEFLKFRHKQLLSPPPFDVSSIASMDDLEAEMKDLIDATPVRPELPMPNYVKHNPQASEVGKLSAAGLAIEYENTAKEIEAMISSMTKMEQDRAADTLRVVQEHEALVEQIKTAMAACSKTAQAYRDRAAAIFDHIQQAQIVAQDVRKACQELQARIAQPEGAPEPAR